MDGDITSNMRIIHRKTDEGGTEYPVIIQVTNSVGDTSMISITAYREDMTTYSIPRPALSEYIVYSKVGEDIDLSQYIIGYYKNGTLYRFDDDTAHEEGSFDINNIIRDTSGVDISTSGQYVVKFTIRYTPKGSSIQEDLGSVELYWIVEE
jgi:hypothetical protein